MPEAIWVAWNPAAGSADKAGELRSTLEARLDCILRETSTREEIVEFARAGAQDGARMVVAAGGDGTVNAVVNGLDAAGRPEVPLAVLPLGTGNDLCRTLAIPDDPAEALDLLATGVVQRIDRVRAESPSLRMHYVNMGSGGFSAQVVQAADGDLKKRWGPLAYLRGAAQTAGDLTQYHVRVQVDDQPAVHLALYNIILANGRTTSRGLLLAPRANPQDGLLEVMLVPGSGLTDMAKLAANGSPAGIWKPINSSICAAPASRSNRLRPCRSRLMETWLPTNHWSSPLTRNRSPSWWDRSTPLNLEVRSAKRGKRQVVAVAGGGVTRAIAPARRSACVPGPPPKRQPGGL